MKELIAKIKNTSPIENLVGILGEDLGELLRKLIKEAEIMDKQLDILTDTIEYIQNHEVNVNDKIYRILNIAIAKMGTVRRDYDAKN